MRDQTRPPPSPIPLTDSLNERPSAERVTAARILRRVGVAPVPLRLMIIGAAIGALSLSQDIRAAPATGQANVSVRIVSASVSVVGAQVVVTRTPGQATARLVENVHVIHDRSCVGDRPTCQLVVTDLP